MVCGDNRFKLIEKYKNKLIESTNIETAKDEMAVIDSILFRFWQMGWLDKLENSDQQKEEIKKLERIEYYADKTIEALKKENEKQEAEIERLQNDCKECASNSREWFEILRTEFAKKKSEAIKEFAERLKDTSEDRTDWGHPYVLCKDIDNIVKEMVGE